MRLPSRDLQRCAGSLLVLAYLLAFITPSRAAAAEPSPFGNGAEWSVPLSAEGALVPLPDGGAVVNATNTPPPPGAAVLTGILPTGSVDWRLSSPDALYVTEIETDSQGNTYRLISHGGEQFLAAASGSTELWRRPLDADWSHHVAIGADGQVYLLSSNGSTTELYKFAASDGQELLAPVELPGFLGDYFDNFLAYASGLVVYSNLGTVFIGYDGQLVSEYIEPPRNTEKASARALAVSPSGILYVLRSLEDSRFSDCNGGPERYFLVGLDASGATWETELTDMSECSLGSIYLNVTPEGALITSHGGTSTGSVGTRLAAYDPNGNLRWQHDADPPAGTSTIDLHPTKVDVNGQVVVAQTFGYSCNLWSDGCSGVQIDRFGADGERIDGHMLMGPSDEHADAYSWFGGHLALTPGRLLIGLAYSDEGRIYGDRTPSLDAFAMPGLGAQYPEAVLWETMGEAEVPTPLRPKQTVIMGDSFSSGEGVPSFERGTNVRTPPSRRNLCHRSENAYARLLERAESIRLDAFVACAGATTFDVREHAQYPTQPPQVRALTPQTEQVILTAGGNDVGFEQFATDCVVIGCVVLADRVESRTFVLQRVLLPRLLREIRRRTNPTTEIIIMGYPHIVPDPDRVDITGCSAIRLRPFKQIIPEEAQMIRQVIERLNTSIRSAADAAGATYLDPTEMFEGHELCTEAPWFNGVRYRNRAYSFHPNASGQEAYARLLATELDRARQEVYIHE